MVLLPRGFVPYAKAEAIAVGQCNRSQLSATLMSDGGALPHPGRLSRVEFPVALFDAASALVPSDDDADMVRAGALASGGDFLLRFAGCQGKDLIPQGWRAALAPAGFPTVARRRPRGRAGAAALVAVAGVFAAAIFSARVPLV